MDIVKTCKIMAMKYIIRTIGRTSTGINISFNEGFTSGVMLDYIYRNQANGKFLIGCLVDRIYLSHPGWQVIRIRKSNLKQLLRDAISKQRQLGHQPVMLDIASGPAQYIIEILSEDETKDVQAFCRDLNEHSLNLGQSNALNHGLNNITFASGDALDKTSLAEIYPMPNIVISSGFYDWIVDDIIIRKSIGIIYDLLPSEGYFVFTNQSGHVDLDMVESTFLDFNKQPLRMVIRPTELINSWVKDAGFKIIKTTADNAGHYSVTLAQKAS